MPGGAGPHPSLRGSRGGGARGPGRVFPGPSGAVRVWAALARRLRSRSLCATLAPPLPPSPPAGGVGRGARLGLGWRRGYVTRSAGCQGVWVGGGGCLRGWGKAGMRQPGVFFAHPHPRRRAGAGRAALVGWGVCTGRSGERACLCF